MEQPHPSRGRPNRRQDYVQGKRKPPPYQRHPRPPPPPPTAARPAIEERPWPNQNTYSSPPPPPPTIKDPFAEKFAIAFESTSTTQSPRNTIKRKLLLPIISGGYASTNYQGGSRQGQKNDKNGIDGEEIALQVVASNDIDALEKANEYSKQASSEKDADKMSQEKLINENHEDKAHVTVSVDVTEQATVSEIPKLSWSSTTAPPAYESRVDQTNNDPLLSESSPYFPVIPQVAQTELTEADTIITKEKTGEEQDVAHIITDKLTDIFRAPELDGMYDETQELLAAQRKTDNNYFSIDLSTSFGGKPKNSAQGIIQTNKPQSNPEPNNSQFVASVEEVPLFNSVDFSSSNTRKNAGSADRQKVTASTTSTTSTTTTTPSPYILQPGSPMLSTSLDDATSITEDQLEQVKDKDQYVRFVAQPPTQINVHIPANGGNAKVVEGSHSQSNLGLSHSNNLDATGHFAPPVSESLPESPFYQLGYHSNVPGESAGIGKFPDSIDPREVDPNIFHEDRPTLPQQLTTTGNKSPVKNIYPLGKAPPKNEDQLPALLGTNNKIPAKRQKPTIDRTNKLPVSKPKDLRKPTPKPSSFLDFLIPSFLSGRGSSNRADPEGPTPPKQNRVQQGNGGLKSVKKLPVPTRPPNTFPDDLELGGRLNPILIKVPEGGFQNGMQGPPPSFFPKPPSLEDWERHAEERQNVLAARKGSQVSKRVEQEEPIRSVNHLQNTLYNGKMRDSLYAPDAPLPENAIAGSEEPVVLSNEIENENLQIPTSKDSRPLLKLPIPPPPIVKLPIKNKRMPPIHPPKPPVLQKTPLPMTSQPVIGLPRVPPGRKQAPFLMGPKQKPLRPPVVSTPNLQPPLNRQNPNSNRRSSNIPTDSNYITPTKMSKSENELYLAKLKDPEFVQNLTRSYVFHHTDPASSKSIDQTSNVVGQGPVSYVPQRQIDPFFFRPKHESEPVQNNHLRSQFRKNNDINLLHQPQTGFKRHELPPLDRIAPASRPVSSKNINRLQNKPHVVYKAVERNDPNPLSAYERRNSIYKRITTRMPISTTTTITTTTTVPTSTTVHSSTSTSNPIAEHISSLLKHLTDGNKNGENEDGVPTLLFDDKQNTVVLEYVSPDGENQKPEKIDSNTPSASDDSNIKDDMKDENIARVDEGSDTLIANELPIDSEHDNVVIEDVNQIQDILLNDEGFATYLQHLQDQKENSVGTGKTINENAPMTDSNSIQENVNDKHDADHETSLPTKTFQLDEVFQPSATMTETDWFILDENGRRRRKMSNDEIEEVKHIIEEKISTENQDIIVSTSTENVEVMSENPIINTDINAQTEVSTAAPTVPNTSTQKVDLEMFGGFQPVAGPIEG